MDQERVGLTVREMAAALNVRLGTAYGCCGTKRPPDGRMKTAEWMV